MTTFTVDWTDHNGVTQRTEITQSDNTSNALPVVLLLHGMDGNIHHMSDPGTSPGMNFDLAFVPPREIDRGWHGYPNVGLWSLLTSPKKNVNGLQGALSQFGYLTLNYAQRGPNENLSIPVEELSGVVRALLAKFGRKLIFVCHSRGGLLVRLFLQYNRGDVSLLSRIAGIITLHSPHQGSEVADFAAQVRKVVHDLQPMGQNCPPLQSVLDLVNAQVSHPAIGELSPSGPFLTGLRATEANPLPVAVPIHTFGGTNPRLLNVWPSIFDAMSLVPQWHWPPYHWTTIQRPIDEIHLLDGTPASLITPEERAGGDVLVTDTRSHLPGEVSHHTNAIHHAAALWDPYVQTQVRDVLRTLASNAAFINQNVPQTMSSGAAYPVSITMANTGSSTWISGGNYPYRLGTQNPQDNLVWGINRKDVPAAVAPGAQAAFNFNITAPAAAGYYHFQWRMVQEFMEWFGATSPDLYIRVGQIAPITALTVNSTSVAAGQTLVLTVSLAGPAPVTGVPVSLTSSYPAAITVPPTITIPANASSVTVNIATRPVPVPYTVTLTATIDATRSVDIHVTPSAQYPYGKQMSAGVGGSLL